jgi:hypothetical protein
MSFNRAQFDELIAAISDFHRSCFSYATVLVAYQRTEKDPTRHGCYARLHRVLHDTQLQTEQWLKDAPKHRPAE